ncbi:DUF3742 family protein [Entomomonas moraniae]|uniref:DUF3742 family protein n=1 Tax=Entomomonas moraniae TaxID=2213226 RepID=A0A3S9XD26_9GAMM|nr:DUF3742 family protein [Entomomonas moraniae]AZS50218.1 DUF3742 family protein [Entomomonas moraniae]
MTTYTQSIWQKVRQLFSRGFEKVTAKEVSITNAARSKLSGLGYGLTKIVFFIIKLAVLLVLAWFALWLLLFMVIAGVIGFFVFKKKLKDYANMAQMQGQTFQEEVYKKTGKRSYTFDNQGNIVD